MLVTSAFHLQHAYASPDAQRSMSTNMTGDALGVLHALSHFGAVFSVKNRCEVPNPLR